MDSTGLTLSRRWRLFPNLFPLMGYMVGSFVNDDFMVFEPGRKFDVVVSFGFIEHLTDLGDILDKRAELVASGGYLVVEVPDCIGAVQ